MNDFTIKCSVEMLYLLFISIIPVALYIYFRHIKHYSIVEASYLYYTIVVAFFLYISINTVQILLLLSISDVIKLLSLYLTVLIINLYLVKKFTPGIYMIFDSDKDSLNAQLGTVLTEYNILNEFIDKKYVVTKDRRQVYCRDDITYCIVSFREIIDLECYEKIRDRFFQLQSDSQTAEINLVKVLSIGIIPLCIVYLLIKLIVI